MQRETGCAAPQALRSRRRPRQRPLEEKRPEREGRARGQPQGRVSRRPVGRAESGCARQRHVRAGERTAECRTPRCERASTIGPARD
eukprot:scaffold97476_cov36-Phaeocystis_antarctica.AAC.1